MLLARIYEVFPLTCPQCRAEMRIIAFITEAVDVRAILEYIGEPATPPRPVSPRRGVRRYGTKTIQSMPSMLRHARAGDPCSQPAILSSRHNTNGQKTVLLQTEPVATFNQVAVPSQSAGGGRVMAVCCRLRKDIWRLRACGTAHPRWDAEDSRKLGRTKHGALCARSLFFAVKRAVERCG